MWLVYCVNSKLQEDVLQETEETGEKGETWETQVTQGNTGDTGLTSSTVLRHEIKPKMGEISNRYVKVLKRF